MIIYYHIPVDIFMDFIFVSGMIYFHTKSENINFLSIQSCKGRGKKEVAYVLDIVWEQY